MFTIIKNLVFGPIIGYQTTMFDAIGENERNKVIPFNWDYNNKDKTEELNNLKMYLNFGVSTVIYGCSEREGSSYLVLHHITDKITEVVGVKIINNQFREYDNIGKYSYNPNKFTWDNISKMIDYSTIIGQLCRYYERLDNAPLTCNKYIAGFNFVEIYDKEVASLFPKYEVMKFNKNITVYNKELMGVSISREDKSKHEVKVCKINNIPPECIYVNDVKSLIAAVNKFCGKN